MNAAIAWNTFHRILTRPMVIVLLVSHVVFGLSIMGLQHGHQYFDFKYWQFRQAIWIGYTWVLGAGLIGRDFSDGILPLIFSRPISRGTYVLSRWLGLVMAVGAVILLDAVLGLFFIGSVERIDLVAYLAGLGISFWMVAATAALLALFSSLVPGHGDLGLFFGGWLLLYLMTLIIDDRTLEKTLAKAFALVLIPGSGIFDSDSYTEAAFIFGWAGVQGFLCLYLAVLVMKEKEITYVMAS